MPVAIRVFFLIFQFCDIKNLMIFNQELSKSSHIYTRKRKKIQYFPNSFGEEVTKFVGKKIHWNL
jgi:hypothetical protein